MIHSRCKFCSRRRIRKTLCLLSAPKLTVRPRPALRGRTSKEFPRVRNQLRPHRSCVSCPLPSALRGRTSKEFPRVRNQLERTSKEFPRVRNQLERMSKEFPTGVRCVCQTKDNQQSQSRRKRFPRSQSYQHPSLLILGYEVVYLATGTPANNRLNSYVRGQSWTRTRYAVVRGQSWTLNSCPRTVVDSAEDRYTEDRFYRKYLFKIRYLNCSYKGM